MCQRRLFDGLRRSGDLRVLVLWSILEDWTIRIWGIIHGCTVLESGTHTHINRLLIDISV